MSGRATAAVRRLTFEPMYASIGTDIPSGSGWAFEPKYDGIRVLAFVDRDRIALVTRNGKHKTKQFPEIVEALRTLGRRARRPLVLDGEIVALRNGRPGRFQALQARMHVTDETAIRRHAVESPAALIAFDLLLDGDDVIVEEPWTTRRQRLERVLARDAEHLRLGESSVGRGSQLLERARAAGWEGIIAKRTDAPYEPGRRSRNWSKLKVEHRQEFVVGGWTEPRKSRQHIGALLLGFFEDDRLVYAGHTGGGFTQEGLRQMYRRLAPLEITTCPFDRVPRTNEVAHWVQPSVVVEVKFNEWTADGKLRQPIFLGVRDDKRAREVGRERESIQHRAIARGRARRRSPTTMKRPRKTTAKRSTRNRKHAAKKRGVRTSAGTRAAPRTAKASAPKRGRSRSSKRDGPSSAVLEQLDRVERDGGDGTIEFEDGRTLSVTSLGKVFIPESGYTKGDIMRYYARVASVMLPWIADRPLVLKRYPNGIDKPSFFQQNAGNNVPAGVRTALVPVEREGEKPRFLGGDLLTLLYTVQLGCISVDPWHSRIESLDDADYTILDLDPGPKASFARVGEVARAVREELDRASLHGALKTSGASGMHVYVPLPAGASYEVAIQLAELIARRVATAVPKLATVVRSVSSRPPASVYVDYQQNVRGKSVAGPLAARAQSAATVSMPISWDVLDGSLKPTQFTIETVPSEHPLVQAEEAWSVTGRVPASLRRALAMVSA